MKKCFTLISILIFLTQCRKDEVTNSIKSISLFASPNITEVFLSWQCIEGFSDSLVDYRLVLGDSIIVEKLKAKTYKIHNLTENTKYTGTIEAFLGSKEIANSAFEFTTLEFPPPIEFKVNEIAIKNNSISISWDRSISNDKKLIVYDIYINNILKIAGIEKTTCVINGLTQSSSYTCQIIARNIYDKTTKTGFSFQTIGVEKSVLVHKFIQFEERLRDFAYYIPINYDSTKNFPLVIHLHGAGGNAWNEIKRNALADRENFIFLMPQALLGSYNGETIYQWNAHYIFPWDDVSFLGYLIDFFYTKYNIDLSRVYISGMSNGGFMTYFAGCKLQNRVAAIAPMAGLISNNVWSGYTLNRPIPLCYIHGTADNTVNINGNSGSLSAAAIIKFWINNNGCDSVPFITQIPNINTSDNSTVTLYQYHGYTTDSEIQYYMINGGGHSVPGVEFGANMDINAFEVTWQFFKRHNFPYYAAGKIVDI